MQTNHLLLESNWKADPLKVICQQRLCNDTPFVFIFAGTCHRPKRLASNSSSHQALLTPYANFSPCSDSSRGSHRLARSREFFQIGLPGRYNEGCQNTRGRISGSCGDSNIHAEALLYSPARQMSKLRSPQVYNTRTSHTERCVENDTLTSLQMRDVSEHEIPWTSVHE